MTEQMSSVTAQDRRKSVFRWCNENNLDMLAIKMTPDEGVGYFLAKNDNGFYIYSFQDLHYFELERWPKSMKKRAENNYKRYG